MSETSSNMSAEQIKVLQMVEAIDSGAELNEGVRAEILDGLEKFECWAPFFRLINRNIQNPSVRSLDDYIRLAKVQNIFLEDVFEAAETCAQAVVALNLSFEAFTEEVIPRVIEFEDWTAEATILQAITGKFSEKKDQIGSMERLCLLFEKKTFNETQLNESYSKLLDLDPLNIKALRYFKVIFSQNYEWEKVVSILHSLLQAHHHPQNIFRVGQELSAVYLYQLDQPQEAINIIDKYCDGSPLDASTIKYDAYQRLGHWDGCLGVLRECLLNVTADSERAVLHFKIGQLLERLKRNEEAAENYENCLSLDGRLLEAYENLIYLALANSDWKGVKIQMKKLSNALSDEASKEQIAEALTRLREGVEGAGNT